MTALTSSAPALEANPHAIARYIKDPIHGFIKVTRLLTRFIDTRHFQRLRDVKQLGTTSYVWPGGSHTRFEHSLGVAHLAREMATHLQQQQPELNITDRDVGCVEIAALCHDLGHGPWSHVWDSMFIPKAMPGSKWKHEHASEMMLDDLIKDYKIPIPHADHEFVKAIIAGAPYRTPDEKPFLFEIVANSRNGLDVDKIDYIHRDSHMVGDPINLSPELLVKSARVLDNQICYNIKNADQIYDLFQARFKLHKSLYNHKAAKAIEHMIIDGLLKAEPHMHIAAKIKDPKQFLSLTDNIMHTIRFSDRPELREAQDILNRIPDRDLYRCVDTKVVDWLLKDLFEESVTPAKIVEAALSMSAPNTPCVEQGESSSLSRSGSVDTLVFEPLKEEDVIVDTAVLHFGQKEKNPLDSMRFYSKLLPNECHKAGRGDYSGVRPKYFAEVLLRIYTKKSEHFGLVQAGYRAVLADMARKHGNKTAYGDDWSPEDDIQIATNTEADYPPTSPTSLGPTSPEREAPITPKANIKPLGRHSRNASLTTSIHGGEPAAGSPFSNNLFTTVHKSFGGPSSPSLSAKKATLKRKTPSLDSLGFGSGIKSGVAGNAQRSVSQGLPGGSEAVGGSGGKTLLGPAIGRHDSGGSADPFGGSSLLMHPGGRGESPSPRGKRRRPEGDDLPLEPRGKGESASPTVKRRK